MTERGMSLIEVLIALAIGAIACIVPAWRAVRVEAPPKWYRPMAIAAGLLAMAIGMTLVVLIILAGLNAL